MGVQGMPEDEDFDLDNSTAIDEFSYLDPTTDGWLETLYRHPSGRFFKHIYSAMDSDHGGAIFSEWMSDDEAREWLSEHSTPETLAEYFPG